MRSCSPTTSWSSAPARSRSGPRSAAWTLSALMTACTCCTRWATRSPSCAPSRKPRRPPRSSSAPGTSAWRWPTPSPPAACRSSRWNSCPRCCPPSTRRSAALVHEQLADRGVEVLTGTTVRQITRATAGEAGRLQVEATAADGTRGDPAGRHGPGRRRRPPRHHPRRQRRGSAGRPGRDRRGPGHADQSPRRVRRRGLRGHLAPAARRDLPAARHHRPQAGPRRRGERPRRAPGSSPGAWAPRW